MSMIKRWRFMDSVKNLQHCSQSSSTTMGTFHEAIKPILVIAQLFGVLPVENITAKDPSTMKFRWKSLRFFFAVFVTLCCGIEAILTIYWTLRKRVEFGKMVYLVFYVTNFLSFVCFLILARNWPTLMVKWHEVERKLPPPRTKSERRSLLVRMRSIAAIILTISLIEHILSIVSSIAIVKDCPNITNIMKAYFVKSFPHVFSFVRYTPALSVYVKFIHVTSTFVWSFADLFIMMISCGLSEKFRLINERMLEDKGKVRVCIYFYICQLRLTSSYFVSLPTFLLFIQTHWKFNPPEYWSDYRRYYRSICDLVSIIDDKISTITILSMSNNLFFICVQLLNSME